VCPQVSIGRATRQTLLATFRSPTRGRLRANPQANGGDLMIGRVGRFGRLNLVGSVRSTVFRCSGGASGHMACGAFKKRRGRAFSTACTERGLFTEKSSVSDPCFGSGIHPVHSRGVVIKGIDGLKSAVRPFGLNQPLITVTQYDVKKRSSLGRAHFNNVAGICDGQRATLWNLVEEVSHSLIEPQPAGRTGLIYKVVNRRLAQLVLKPITVSDVHL